MVAHPMKPFSLVVPLLVAGSAVAADNFVTVSSPAATLTVAEAGGAIVGFALPGGPVNPFTWAFAPEEVPENNRRGAPYRGHFLCVGRWGPVEPGEKAAGVPDNGEPQSLPWTIAPRARTDVLEMEVTAPLEQWRVHRRMTMAPGAAWCEVEESFTNLLQTGRFAFLVQHGTLGAEFLRRDSILSCNAGAGFSQLLNRGGVVRSEYRWPQGVRDEKGAPLDLRRCDADVDYVTTHVIDDEWGWATVATPGHGLLVGYLWKTADYPWLHLWHSMRRGQPWSQGIEFGTTGQGGLATPEQRMRAGFHGRDNVLFVDSGATLRRSYSVFLLRVPADFRETTAVKRTGDRVEVRYRTDAGEQVAALDVGGR